MATEEELIEKIKELRIENALENIFKLFLSKYYIEGDSHDFILKLKDSLTYEEMLIMREQSKGNYNITVYVMNDALVICFNVNKSKIEFLKEQLIVWIQTINIQKAN